jgi:serine protease Do
MSGRGEGGRRRWARGAVLVFCMVAGLLAGLAGRRVGGEEPVAVAAAKGLSRAFRSAAKQVLPTVVIIRAKVKPRRLSLPESPSYGTNPFQGTPLEDFFKDQAPGYEVNPFNLPREGTGSGVIIDPAGIILTNDHVIEGADEVVVELADGRQFHAAKVQSDEQSDLAIVRIEAGGSLPAAALGDSDKMQIGDWVLAIGTPMGLDLSVSAGIISGTARTLPSGRRAEYLQTDAAINPGNSGGPLVNLDGEVVGINTAIASDTGGYQGVGFAIPSNLAKWVTSQLIKRGAVQRAYLGIRLGEIDAALAAKLGVLPGRGVKVVEVLPETPAAKAGVREGDVILAYAGRKVHSARPLQEIIERMPPGEVQPLAILRDGEQLALQVAAAAMPKEIDAITSAGAGRQEGLGVTTFKSKELGLEVCDLYKDMVGRLGYEGLSGVVVTAVEDGSIAADAGIRERTLILRVGKRPIRNSSDLAEALKSESLHRGILFLVRMPDGGNRFLVLRQ